MGLACMGGNYGNSDIGMTWYGIERSVRLMIPGISEGEIVTRCRQTAYSYDIRMKTYLNSTISSLVELVIFKLYAM